MYCRPDDRFSGSSKLASRSNENPHIELAVQHSPSPPAQWLFRPPSEILKTTLHVRPGGSFVYPPLTIPPERFQDVKRVVMVAGGVGINPLMSMLLSMEQHSPPAILLYAVRKPPPQEGGFPDENGVPRSGVLFLERLITLAASYPKRISIHLYLTGDGQLGGSREALDDAVRKGNVKVFEGRRWRHDELEEALGEERERENTVAYVCGPPQMTDEDVEVLRVAPGMKGDWVFCEKWW